MLARPIALAVLIAFGAFPVAAPLAAQTAPPTVTCQGRDVMAALSAPDREALVAAEAATPNGQGNHWRATRGDQVIDLVGTFHLPDPRMEPVMQRLAPVIASSDRVYLEATRAEIADLQKAVGERPDMMILQGKTLSERLSEDDWAALSGALEARGIPGFMAAKMQPWYISVLLGIPPCAMAAMTSRPEGLDNRIEAAADADHVPTVALEPYDTIFKAFATFTTDEQIEMVRIALLTEAEAEDVMTTMTNLYFAERPALIWSLGEKLALDAPGVDKVLVSRDLDRLAEALVDKRNAAWAATLDKAQGKHLLVAVGAGHLPGPKGLLNLLAERGFALTRVEF